MSPKRVDARQKRQEIAAAALQVFTRKSYGDTRIQDIADKAGIGKGTIYEYFRDKAAILHEIFEQEFQQLIAADEDEKGKTPLQLLLDNIVKSFEATNAHREMTRLWFEVWSSRVVDPQHPINEKMQGLFDELAALYSRYIQQGQAEGEIRTELDADITARMIVSALDGITLHSILFRLGVEEAKRRCENFSAMVRANLEISQKST